VWSSVYTGGVGGVQQLQDYWYTYDAMNRFTVTRGNCPAAARGVSATDTTVSVVTGTEGADWLRRGVNAACAVNGVNGVREDYTYTADGYLEATSIGGVVRAVRSNDSLGRVVKYQEYDVVGTASFGRISTYDADNKVLSQQEYNGAPVGAAVRSITFDYQDTALTNNNVGPLASMTSVEGATTVISTYTYDWWDSAKEKTIKAQPNNTSAPDWAPGYSNFTYDVNGHLMQVDDPKGGRSIRYTNDAQGRSWCAMRSEAASPTRKASSLAARSTSTTLSTTWRAIASAMSATTVR
jgi:hypothetical protein